MEVFASYVGQRQRQGLACLNVKGTERDQVTRIVAVRNVVGQQRIRLNPDRVQGVDVGRPYLVVVELAVAKEIVLVAVTAGSAGTAPAKSAETFARLRPEIKGGIAVADPPVERYLERVGRCSNYPHAGNMRHRDDSGVLHIAVVVGYPGDVYQIAVGGAVLREISGRRFQPETADIVSVAPGTQSYLVHVSINEHAHVNTVEPVVTDISNSVVE